MEVSKAQPAYHALFDNVKNVDPGILMMAVSMMNLDVAHDTAKIRMQRDDRLFPTLVKLQPLGGKITEARNKIVQAELQATATQLTELTSLESRYKDNGTVNDVDNNRFKGIQKWGDERELGLSNSTKIIQDIFTDEVRVEKTIRTPYELKPGSTEREYNDAAAEVVDSKETPVRSFLSKTVETDRDEAVEEARAETLNDGIKNGEAKTISEYESGRSTHRLPSGIASDEIQFKEEKVVIIETRERIVERRVTDGKEINDNKSKLNGYTVELKNGTADNKYLRRVIKEDPQITAVKEKLKEAEFEVALTTLSDLHSSVHKIAAQITYIVERIAEHAAAAKAARALVGRFSDELASQRKDAVAMDEALADSKKNNTEDFQKMMTKILEMQEERIPELLNVLTEAIDATDQLLFDVQANLDAQSAEAAESSASVDQPPATDQPAQQPRTDNVAAQDTSASQDRPLREELQAREQTPASTDGATTETQELEELQRRNAV